MALLIIGLLLWAFSHTFKRLMPGPRASLGDEKGKGVVALLGLAGIVLMVVGYRMAEVIPVYSPLPGMGHLNNLLMLISLFFLINGSMKPGVINTIVRHNALTGVVIFSFAHLLVNGDLASIILFGGLALWALLSMALISRAVAWERPERGPISVDIKAFIGAAVFYAIVVAIHMWLGYDLFLGTYG